MVVASRYRPRVDFFPVVLAILGSSGLGYLFEEHLNNLVGVDSLRLSCEVGGYPVSEYRFGDLRYIVT